MRLEKETNALGHIFRLWNSGQIIDTVFNSGVTCRYPFKRSCLSELGVVWFVMMTESPMQSDVHV